MVEVKIVWQCLLKVLIRRLRISLVSSFVFFVRALHVLLLLILIRIPSRRDDFNRFLFRLGLSWKGTDTINSSLYCYTAPASKANWMNPFLL